MSDHETLPYANIDIVHKVDIKSVSANHNKTPPSTPMVNNLDPLIGGVNSAMSFGESRKSISSSELSFDIDTNTECNF